MDVGWYGGGYVGWIGRVRPANFRRQKGVPVKAVRLPPKIVWPHAPAGWF